MGRYLKSEVYKNFVHMIKHDNFQFYRAYPATVILEKSTIDDTYGSRYSRMELERKSNGMRFKYGPMKNICWEL